MILTPLTVAYEAHTVVVSHVHGLLAAADMYVIGFLHDKILEGLTAVMTGFLYFLIGWWLELLVAMVIDLTRSIVVGFLATPAGLDRQIFQEVIGIGDSKSSQIYGKIWYIALVVMAGMFFVEVARGRNQRLLPRRDSGTPRRHTASAVRLDVVRRRYVGTRRDHRLSLSGIRAGQQL